MWSVMAIIYFSCAALGFLVALLGAIFGELGAHGVGGFFGHDIGHDIEVGHDVEVGSHVVEAGAFDHGGMPEASVLNTITIATFVGSFGIFGLIGTWGLGMSPIGSLAFALPTSVIIATVEFVLYVKLFIRAQASSEATTSDILGCEAEVITSIPADKLGEVAYVIKGSRYTAPALSGDGVEIAKGTKVLVIDVKGASLIVSPM